MSKSTEYLSIRIGIGIGIGTGINTRGKKIFATSIATGTFYDTMTTLIIMHLLTGKNQ